MKELIILFFTFMKMGAVNFGGGYAMLPLLQKELVEKHKWTTMEEIQDYFAVGQCTPGVIAVNVSTFIGYKRKGIIGGIVATLGFVFIPIVVILCISSILLQFSNNQYVQDAFAAIRVCVVVLILQAAIKLIKKSIIDYYTLILFLIILFLSIFTEITSIWYVLGAGFLGITYKVLREKIKQNKKEKTPVNEEDEQ